MKGVKTMKKTVNQLIRELQNLREDLKELPVVVQTENGMYFEARAKIGLDKYESPLNGDKPKRIVITYE